MNQHSPYLGHVYATLPRVLSLFDRDPLSATYGIGDRQHVSWCTRDFANATQQGAAHGLARLVQAGLLPDWCSQSTTLAVIRSAFTGTAAITRPDGSLEEAFPFERSFCVTALAAHDLLWAWKLCPAPASATKRKELDCIAPLIAFLRGADESHGFISNHLATAAGALLLWHTITGDDRAEQRGRHLLERILEHASPEGWFAEYGGADPGYQTLCLHYLVLLDQCRPDLGLRPTLDRATEFLSHFAFPDGSFGGLFGARRTCLYYPSGIVALAAGNPSAAALDRHMRQAVADRRCVTLLCMDDDNLIPMFNAYALAATLPDPAGERQPLPCALPAAPMRHFPQAGFVVSNTVDHYTVLSLKLGGAFESSAKDGSCHIADGGSLCIIGAASFSTQTEDPLSQIDLSEQRLIVHCRAGRMLRRRPKPWQFIILRGLAMTVMRAPLLARWIKRLLAYMLMGQKKYYPTRIMRTIRLDTARPQVTAEPEQQLPDGTVFVACGGEHRSIHMASAGYWQGTTPCSD